MGETTQGDVRRSPRAILPRRLLGAFAVIGALVLFSGCAGEPSDHEPEGRQLAEDEVQRLEALGYLSFGSEVDPDPSSGVVLQEPGCGCTGYDLIIYPALGRAELINPKGRVVHAWAGADEVWERATFAPDGSLLVLAREPVAQEPGQQGRRRRVLLRLALDGERLWKRVLPVHHHAAALPDGRIAVLTSRSRAIPELFGEVAAIDNGLAILSPDGASIESEWSLYDMLAARPDLVELRTHRTAEGRVERDFLHANYFQWMPGGVLGERSPLYAAGNVLVTLRKQDLAAVFDLARGEVIWAWGPGEVIGLHEAQVLGNGHILLFDNRSRGQDPEDGGWSRVVELDPLSGEIVWEYRADPPEDFYSHSRGTVARMIGGNTLICSSNQGRLFEVTPEGDVVWEYRTPYRDEEGRRAVLRAERYPRSFVEPLFRRGR